MSERSLNKDSVYYMDGDDEATTIICKTDEAPVRLFIQKSVAEMAREHNLNVFQWADGRGFAINFANVISLDEISVTYGEGGVEGFDIPLLDENTLPSPATNYNLANLHGFALNNGDVSVAFNDHYILALPVKRDEVDQLRRTSIQGRPVKVSDDTKPPEGFKL